MINPRTEKNSLYQILKNRGIKDYSHYLNTSDQDINDNALLGINNLQQAVNIILSACYCKEKVLVIVDSDCDGFTSSALLLNYLYKTFPYWTTNYIEWYIHDGKQHGLADCIEMILQKDYKVIITPDSASNDYEQHRKIKENGQNIIVLDHHLADKISKDAVIINNQLSEYPNKEFSGVGITWQFCRYMDKILKCNYANDFLDLVSIGLVGDMMDMREFETVHLIRKGLKQLNNPFLTHLAEKNKYTLGDTITPIGAAFYIVPLINAMTRSGTLSEKHLIFKAMLQYQAFNEILSNKRGHKIKETELLVEQAVRTAVNIKNRQKRAEDSGLELLENKIKTENLLQHKVILFLLQPQQIDKNIAGLVANKIMAKYQRPCCVLMKIINENGQEVYRGSLRGCANTEDFRQVCLDTNEINWCQGHANAAGIEIPIDNIQSFLEKTDEALKDLSPDIVYNIDLFYENQYINIDDILKIGQANFLWGQKIDEPFILIKNLRISKDKVFLLSPDKSPTLKIHLPNIDIIKFKSSEEEYESLLTEGYLILNIIARACINEWNGNISPQLQIVDYEIIKSVPFVF